MTSRGDAIRMPMDCRQATSLADRPSLQGVGLSSMLDGRRSHGARTCCGPVALEEFARQTTLTLIESGEILLVNSCLPRPTIV